MNKTILLAVVGTIIIMIGLIAIPSLKSRPSLMISDDIAQEKINSINAIFPAGTLLNQPKIVDCTLSEGTETSCFSITVAATPSDFKTGPWCPRHIGDDADKGGIWLDNGQVHDVDGQFVQNLSEFYTDKGWEMYNPETGEIYYTKTVEECAAAARPDVDPAMYNHCVECQPSFLEDGMTITYVIPVTPSISKNIGQTRLSGVGLSLSGVRLDGPAPLDAILDAHTLAPFDDCGGHINLNVGYHIHAITGCGAKHDHNGHASMIGIAMDGHALFERTNKNGTEPDDLDSCRGHDVDGLEYHYHVNDAGANAILPCFKTETGCSSSDNNLVCNASKKSRPH